MTSNLELKKVKEVPSFSPKVSLIFDNLETVREVMDICGGEFETNLTRFMKDLSKYLPSQIPSLMEWEGPSMQGNSIHFRAGSRWKIAKDKSISIFIDPGYPLVLSPSNAASVGLFIPSTWKKNKTFNGRFRRIKPADWVYIEDLEKPYRDECDQDYAFWAWIKYTDYVRRGKFDEVAFLSRVVQQMREAVNLKPKIDKILTSLV